MEVLNLNSIDPRCPTFKLEYILKKIEPDKLERNEMIVKVSTQISYFKNVIFFTKFRKLFLEIKHAIIIISIFRVLYC